MGWPKSKIEDWILVRFKRPPVLWLSTNAVQPPQCTCSTPDLAHRRRRPADVLAARPSYGIVHMQFKFFFACGVLFSVLPLHSSFRFVRPFRSFPVLQTFPFLSSGFSVPRSFLIRSFFVPISRSSDSSVSLPFLFDALQTFPFLFCSSFLFLFYAFQRFSSVSRRQVLTEHR